MRKVLEGYLNGFLGLYFFIFILLILMVKTCTGLLLDSDYEVISTEVIDTNTVNRFTDSVLNSLSAGRSCICLKNENETDTFFQSSESLRNYVEMNNANRSTRKVNAFREKKRQFVKMTFYKGSFVVKQLDLALSKESNLEVVEKEETYGAIYYQNFVQLYKDDKFLERIYLTKVNNDKYSFRHKLGSDSLDRTWICNELK